MTKTLFDIIFVSVVGFLVYDDVKMMILNSLIFSSVIVLLKTHKSIFEFDMVFYLRNTVFSLLVSSIISVLIFNGFRFQSGLLEEVISITSISFSCIFSCNVKQNL